MFIKKQRSNDTLINRYFYQALSVGYIQLKQAKDGTPKLSQIVIYIISYENWDIVWRVLTVCQNDRREFCKLGESNNTLFITRQVHRRFTKRVKIVHEAR